MADNYETELDRTKQQEPSGQQKPAGTSCILDGRYLPPPQDGDAFSHHFPPDYAGSGSADV